MEVGDEGGEVPADEEPTLVNNATADPLLPDEIIPAATAAASEATEHNT